MISRVRRALLVVAIAVAGVAAVPSAASAGGFTFCGAYYYAGQHCASPSKHNLNAVGAKAVNSDGSVNYGVIVCAGIGSSASNNSADVEGYVCGYGEVFNPVDGAQTKLGHAKAFHYAGPGTYINGYAYTP